MKYIGNLIYGISGEKRGSLRSCLLVVMHKVQGINTARLLESWDTTFDKGAPIWVLYQWMLLLLQGGGVCGTISVQWRGKWGITESDYRQKPQQDRLFSRGASVLTRELLIQLS